jgi:hypothetical protein
MFTGAHLDYDVESCQMVDLLFLVVFTHVLGLHFLTTSCPLIFWIQLMAPHVGSTGFCVLYAFDMVAKVLHVLDPTISCEGAQQVQAVHMYKCARLLAGLEACIKGFFSGWEMDARQWQYCFHRNLNTRVKK